MANDFKTPTILLNESIIGFEDSSEFLGIANTTYEGMVADYKGMPTGGTIQVRMRDYPSIDHGRVATTAPIIQQFESIVVEETNRLNKAFELTSLELAVDRTPLTDTTTYQTGQAMAQVCDLDVATKLKMNTFMYQGTSGSSDFNFDKLNQMSAIMDELAMPRDRTLIMNTADYQTLTSSIHSANLFDEPLNKSINRDIFVGRYGRFDMAKSNVLIGLDHTAGTVGGDAGLTLSNPVASSDYKSGTITIGGVAAGKTIVAGDRITVSGTKLINPLTKKVTRQSLQFVVQNDVTESGGNLTDVQVIPGMVPVTTANAGWFANIAALPANGDAISVEGNHRLNFAVTKPGLTFASIQLDDLSTIADVFGSGQELKKFKSSRSQYSNLAMRLGFDSEILNDVAFWRLDLQPVYHAFLRYNFAYITAV